MVDEAGVLGLGLADGVAVDAGAGVEAAAVSELGLGVVVVLGFDPRLSFL